MPDRDCLFEGLPAKGTSLAQFYETYDDLAAWRLDVRSMLLHMDLLEPKGLAGYIYTQVSDIEEETNGILTYDRRVNKFR